MDEEVEEGEGEEESGSKSGGEPITRTSPTMWVGLKE